MNKISINSENDFTIKTVKNYSLHSGERQVSPVLNEIRKDHRARYDMVCDYLTEHKLNISSILDIFCGNGYGSYMLAKAFKNSYVLGIDASLEAVNLANDSYSLENNLFSQKKFPFSLPERAYDLIVCFESLEHVQNDSGLLRVIHKSLKKNGVAFISVPNQDEHPLEKNPHPFHFRHYAHDEFLSKLNQLFIVENWYGQNTYVFKDRVNTSKLLPENEMLPNEKSPGQVNIYLVSKS